MLILAWARKSINAARFTYHEVPRSDYQPNTLLVHVIGSNQKSTPCMEQSSPAVSTVLIRTVDETNETCALRREALSSTELGLHVSVVLGCFGS